MPLPVLSQLNKFYPIHSFASAFSTIVTILVDIMRSSNNLFILTKAKFRLQKNNNLFYIWYLVYIVISYHN